MIGLEIFGEISGEERLMSMQTTEAGYNTLCRKHKYITSLFVLICSLIMEALRTCIQACEHIHERVTVYVKA